MRIHSNTNVKTDINLDQPSWTCMQPKSTSFVAQLCAAWNSHDPAAAAALYADDCQGSDISQVAPLQGRAEMQDYFARFFAAFPDVQLRVDSVVQEENRYALAWTAEGTHLGKLMNIPPSGKNIAVRGMSQVVVKDGLITTSAVVWDMAGLLRSIGLLPRLNR